MYPEVMRAGIGVLVAVIGCASPTVPTAGFLAVHSAASVAAPVTDKAITVRGVQGVLAANGRYLGQVWVRNDGYRSRVEAVREATRVAASAGGTHIMLSNAEVTRAETTRYVHPDYVRPDGIQRTENQRQRLSSTETYDSEVRATFDVFRVEPKDWEQLQPPLRPLPLPRDGDRSLQGGPK